MITRKPRWNSRALPSWPLPVPCPAQPWELPGIGGIGKEEAKMRTCPKHPPPPPTPGFLRLLEVKESLAHPSVFEATFLEEPMGIGLVRDWMTSRVPFT